MLISNDPIGDLTYFFHFPPQDCLDTVWNFPPLPSTFLGPTSFVYSFIDKEVVPQGVSQDYCFVFRGH